jgi:hypothetical protein
MNAGLVINAALTALGIGPIHALTIPQEKQSTLPAAVFHVISDTPFPDQCGSDDEASDDVRVQIDIYAATYDGMKALKSHLIVLMGATDPGCERVGGFETYDVDLKAHRASVDFMFHPSSAEDSPA